MIAVNAITFAQCTIVNFLCCFNLIANLWGEMFMSFGKFPSICTRDTDFTLGHILSFRTQRAQMKCFEAA